MIVVRDSARPSRNDLIIPLFLRLSKTTLVLRELGGCTDPMVQPMVRYGCVAQISIVRASTALSLACDEFVPENIFAQPEASA